ncbi:MAG: response regulator transcription factor [Proteobacteria bacterium]|nr:response regulator transcription factor [Pseudomonadota bacterium]MBU1232764.1 response regulator transcription factor [Pseudomonadota bacterium]MBU1420754.1 response regulator transcription factor [Pseudomonadota bacterium]MBU1456399.1 response regulator transcription factor [Pseudomonadota bacterium]
MKSKILIVDDHPIFRMGMKELINQAEDFTVCAVAADIFEARKALAAEAPDMAIIDISLAEDNGLELVKEISGSDKNIPVLVLSMHDESVWAERAIRAGARGYVMKREASESVISALRNIRAGRIHASSNMVALLLDKLQVNPNCKGVSTVDILTDRELEVFRLIGAGLSTREIANQMTLGVKTIGTYRDRIKQKLGLKNATELTRRAVLWTANECFHKRHPSL